MGKSKRIWSTALACLLTGASANCLSAIIVTATETGGDVVFSGGGSADLTGLSYSTTTNVTSGAIPDGPVFYMNAGSNVDVFTGLSGPSDFGTNNILAASSSSGDVFGLSSSTSILLPDNYVSGAILSAAMTFNGQTFASMGLTPGTYVWSWGAGGAGNDSLTLQIGDADVPEPAMIALMGLGLAGIGYQRCKQNKAA